MNKTLLCFLIVAAVGKAIYHFGQKSIPASANPMVALMGAYAVAFILAAISAPFFRTAGAPVWTAQVFNAPVVIVGVGILLIEIGFLSAYRVGGSLQWSGVAVNAAAAVVLLPGALIVFRGTFSPVRFAGLALCLVGLWLLVRKSS